MARTNTSVITCDRCGCECKYAGNEIAWWDSYKLLYIRSMRKLRKAIRKEGGELHVLTGFSQYPAAISNQYGFVDLCDSCNEELQIWWKKGKYNA